MHEFCLYVGVDKFGRITAHQREQLLNLMSALSDRRINTNWIVSGNHIRCYQIINIIFNIHSICKKKGIIVHIELCQTNKKVTILSRILMRHLPVTTYSSDQDNDNDYASLKFLNQPKSCMFNSCLGNTIYLKQDASLTICPRAERISLNQLKNGEPLNSVFDTEDFNSLLRSQIEKRDCCKVNCSLFRLCHGGCPVQENSSVCLIQKKVENLCVTDNVKQLQEIKKIANLYRG